MGNGEKARAIPLRCGLSIGRDPRNYLVIDHPDVRDVHATIEQHGDALQLECAAHACVVLADGSEVSRLNLIEGTRCRIGDVILTCFDARSVQYDEDESHCMRCGLELYDLPITRRFCPRCGLNLSAGALVPVSLVIAHPPLPVLPLVEPLEPAHSLMIAGYATAMTKLGVRYEVGQGVARNEDEAIRCYGKAARLGNEDARTRLERWEAPDEGPDPNE
jgi:hypothetical protein